MRAKHVRPVTSEPKATGARTDPGFNPPGSSESPGFRCARGVSTFPSPAPVRCWEPVPQRATTPYRSPYAVRVRTYFLRRMMRCARRRRSGVPTRWGRPEPTPSMDAVAVDGA
jgi:hypothetical protein